MERKYSIEFTRTQLAVMAAGLEFYSRFLAGQWEIPDAMKWKEYELQGEPNDFWEKRNSVEEHFKVLKTIFTRLNANAFYGIGSDNLHPNAKIAYDIYRPILEQFAKEYDLDNPDKACHSVYDYPGLQYSEEGRIKIEENGNK